MNRPQLQIRTEGKLRYQAGTQLFVQPEREFWHDVWNKVWTQLRYQFTPGHWVSFRNRIALTLIGQKYE